MSTVGLPKAVSRHYVAGQIRNFQRPHDNECIVFTVSGRMHVWSFKSGKGWTQTDNLNFDQIATGSSKKY